MIDEKLVQKHMNILGLSRDDAIALIQEDERIDKMTRTAEINDDLSTDQQKNAKKARKADRQPTAFKFDTTKRAKKENADKRYLIETIQNALAECDEIEVTNIERELVFKYNGVKYKLVLSAPRN